MSVVSTATGTNPTTIGGTDGSILVQHISHTPSDPSDILEYSIDYGDTFQSGGFVPYYNYTGLGAGSYFCLMRVNGEFSTPMEIVLTDGSPEPPDPDTIVYRDVYHGEICDKNGDSINVDISLRMEYGDPVPDITDIIFAGDNPIVISYTAPDNNYKQEPINSSDCTVKIKSMLGSFQLSDIFPDDERQYKLTISGAWNWVGFIIPDECSEPFESYYDVEIVASDVLGTLKKVPLVIDITGGGSGHFSSTGVLMRALSQTGLNLKLVVAVNTTEVNMVFAGTNLSPLEKAFINVKGFLKEDLTFVDAYEVIRSICEMWSARLFQWDGMWYLVNVMEKSAGDVDAYLFNDDRTFNSAITIGNEVTVGSVAEFSVAPKGGTSIAKGFLFSKAYYRYGYPTNELYNGNMDTWLSNPTGLPDGWAVVGGVTAETGTRLEGGIATTDFYIIIHDDSSTGYIENDTPVQIRGGDVGTIAFDWYAPTAWSFLGQNCKVQAVIHDVTNDLYFSNIVGWQSGFTTFDTKYNRADLKNQFTTRIDLAPQDGDYQVTFGLRNLQNDASYGFARYELQVNNVTITPGITNAQIKPGVASYCLQQQAYNQSYSKDEILLLHGDEPLDTLRTSGILIDGGSFYGAGEWKRAGYTEGLPLLEIVANSELANHQKAYRIFEAEFMNAYKVDLNINTLLTVDRITGVKFIFLSGDFRLKEGHHNLIFAQAFTDPVIPAINETKEVYE